MSFPTYQPPKPLLVKRAKTMRLAMTPDERKLWFALRQRLQPRSHVRRQVPIGPYIVDFCCLASRLIVEIDGNQQGMDDALAYDARRTVLLEGHGFRVLRFSNHDVIMAIGSELDTIAAALPDPPTYSPFPRAGAEEHPFHG